MMTIIAQAAASDLAKEALRQTEHRADVTFIVVVVLIICAAFGVCVWLTVRQVITFIGDKAVAPAIKAGVDHLNKVGTHLDSVTHLLHRNTEALESLDRTLSSLPCQLAAKTTEMKT